MMKSSRTWISIHAPREGGDFFFLYLYANLVKFQSTPPARGATMFLRRGPVKLKISIHAPREGGDNQFKVRKQGTHRFQSTPPARGATCLFLLLILSHGIFQSTPPARGATITPKRPMTIYGHFNPRPPRGGRRGPQRQGKCQEPISIHAPREGGDSQGFRVITELKISIHAPREGGDPPIFSGE